MYLIIRALVCVSNRRPASPTRRPASAAQPRRPGYGPTYQIFFSARPDPRNYPPDRVDPLGANYPYPVDYLP